MVDARSVLICVGSRADQICSVGAFARAEARAMERRFRRVRVLEPTDLGRYPDLEGVEQPDLVIFHAPSLFDRRVPWGAIQSAWKIRRHFRDIPLIVSVHEYTESPRHWKVRQIAIARLGDGVVANTHWDAAGLRRWHPRVLQSHLGPTLFNTGLLHEPTPVKIAAAANAARENLEREDRYGLKKFKRWVVHPGLLTPGKGLDRLINLARDLSQHDALVVMGGEGAKEADRDFSKASIQSLVNSLGPRLIHIPGPPDEVFTTFLTAADLVVLPYDRGVSERRSSFLSAMSCGGNVWTTGGDLSGPMKLDQTGVHVSTVQEAHLGRVLDETRETQLIRRSKNLRWASERSWDDRLDQFDKFINTQIFS